MAEFLLPHTQVFDLSIEQDIQNHNYIMADQWNTFKSNLIPKFNSNGKLSMNLNFNCSDKININRNVSERFNKNNFTNNSSIPFNSYIWTGPNSKGYAASKLSSDSSLVNVNSVKGKCNSSNQSLQESVGSLNLSNVSSKYTPSTVTKSNKVLPKRSLSKSSPSITKVSPKRSLSKSSPSTTKVSAKRSLSKHSSSIVSNTSKNSITKFSPTRQLNSELLPSHKLSPKYITK